MGLNCVGCTGHKARLEAILLLKSSFIIIITINSRVLTLPFVYNYMHVVHINIYPVNTFSLLETSTNYSVIKKKVKETESDDG